MLMFYKITCKYVSQLKLLALYMMTVCIACRGTQCHYNILYYRAGSGHADSSGVTRRGRGGPPRMIRSSGVTLELRLYFCS